MRIGIDLTATWRPATGMEQVAIEMTRSLLRVDHNNEYILFFSNEIHPQFTEFAGRFDPVVVPRCNEVILKNLRLPPLAKAACLGHMHFPIFPPPWHLECPSGWTVGDATPWLYPETMKLTSRWYYRVLGARAVKANRLLTTFTEASRADIVRILGVAPEQIHVVYPGLRSIFGVYQDSAAFERVRRLYSLPKSFFLFVGTLEPRKNLLRILSAFGRLKSEHRLEPDLVIVGRKGWLHAPIFEELRNRRLAEHVHLTGYVPDEDLVTLYNMARLLILPSLYEGFGLPCIEAMACRCPVVTSNRGALLEVTSDCAVHCNPDDVNSIAEAILLAHTNSSLREKLVANGFQRAASFSWTRYANQFLEIVDRVVGGSTFASERVQ